MVQGRIDVGLVGEVRSDQWGADPALGYILKVKPIESAGIRCGCEKENKQRLLLDFFFA